MMPSYAAILTMKDIVDPGCVGAAANKSYIKSVERDLGIYKGLWSLHLTG